MTQLTPEELNILIQVIQQAVVSVKDASVLIGITNKLGIMLFEMREETESSKETLQSPK